VNSPEAVWKSFWDLLMFVWIVWQSIFVPYRLCFDIEVSEDDDISKLDYVIDICFGIDMILQFNTGFYKNGVLILNR